MKCISILVLVVCVCMTTAAWSQQSASGPHLGKGFLRHHLPKGMSSIASLQSQSSAQASPALNSRVWEFGTYPGGTWAALEGINDFGVAVGFGDVPPLGQGPNGEGYTHTLAVPVFGPHAGEWIDLGTLGGEYSAGWEEPLNSISNTGLIVGHSATSSGYIRGAAWTEKSGMVDLGALADVGYPEYKGSFAMATNRLGTLIVGWSGTDMTCLLGCSDALPVVWTPSGVWEKGKWITKWKIHKLDTTAFPDLTFWYPMAINDLGQIVAMAFTSDWAVGKPLLWNPQPDHKTWKIVELSSSPDFPNNLPFGINDRGEIAGATNSADGSLWTPRLWKPLNSKRTRYTDAILLAIPEGFTGCEAVGINEFGDMTGDCYNDVVDQTTRWTTKDLTFSQVIDIGDGSEAWGVNNFGVASVTYWDSNCPVSCGGAVLIR
jgi:probable HAF family extracellular repeat protein